MSWPNLIQRLGSSWPCTRCTTPNLTWTGCTCPELKEIESSYNWSFPTSQPLSVLMNTFRRRRTPSSTLSKTMTTGNPWTSSADSQWSSVGNWECLQYQLQRMSLHHLCPQNKGHGQTPGSPAAQVQVGVKSAPRQIPTTGETGWRGPRQDPQMAKSRWPQRSNRGLYHRSPRSEPPSTLAPTQHPQEAWRRPKM